MGGKPRRWVLKTGGTALATGLAGCSDGGSGDTADSETDSPGGTATEQETDQTPAEPLPDITVDETWEGFRGDPRNSGATDNSGPSGDTRIRWRVSEATGTPAIADGTVYAQSGRELLAIDAASGEVQWRFSQDPEEAPALSPQEVSSPRVAGDTIFLGTLGIRNNTARVLAIDADSGTVRWRTEVGGSVSLPPAVADGTVYVSSNDNDHDAKVFALDAASGEIQWEYARSLDDEEGRLLQTQTPAVADGRVFVGEPNRLVTAIDGATGEESWHKQTDGLGKGSLTVANGRIFAVNDRLRAFDTTDGTQLWSSTLESPRRRTLTAHDGTLYASDGDMVALDAADGSIQWEATFEGAPRSTILADGSLHVTAKWDTYVESDDDFRSRGRCYTIDAGTGSVRGYHDLIPTEHVAVPASGLLFISTNDAGLIALQEP